MTNFYGRLYRDGSTLKQEGNPEAIRLLCIEQFGFNHFLNDEIFLFLDALADHGVNSFRCFGFWPYGRGLEEEPYSRQGIGYDLSCFNEKYFTYLNDWVAYALEKGIVVRYELFDRCGLTTDEVVSRHHPYNQLVGRDRMAFSDLRNTKLVAIQKRYLDKVVGILREYPNVILGIMNEFMSHKEWHYAMSRYVLSLAPWHLISGTCEGSPAVRDPSCDMFFVHTGTYEFDTGTPHVPEDIQSLRKKTLNEKILGYSTDGFGSRGSHRENPIDMARLAKDANRADIQVLCFLDHKAHNETLPGSSLASRASTNIYDAMTAIFHPTPLGDITPLEPLPDGVFSGTRARDAMSHHQFSFLDRNGRAVNASTRNGFLFFGNYQMYDAQVLQAIYSLYIDDNTYDDAYIAVLDIVKDKETVVTNRLLCRSDFLRAGQHIKLAVSFCAEAGVIYETRVFYLGNAYLAVDGVYVADATVLLDSLPERMPRYEKA